MTAMETLAYRVWEAKFLDSDETIRFSCSTLREISLRQQMERGELTIDPASMVMVAEFTNRNDACRMAGEV